jgi:hypothetical protein
LAMLECLSFGGKIISSYNTIRTHHQRELPTHY